MWYTHSAPCSPTSRPPHVSHQRLLPEAATRAYDNAVRWRVQNVRVAFGREGVQAIEFTHRIVDTAGRTYDYTCGRLHWIRIWIGSRIWVRIGAGIRVWFGARVGV